MNKTEIFVIIDSEEKQQRAIEILEKHGENIWDDTFAFYFDYNFKYLKFDTEDLEWYVGCTGSHLTKITLDQLDELLTESN